MNPKYLERFTYCRRLIFSRHRYDHQPAVLAMTAQSFTECK